jgi:SAM-dependent methyltransferase
MSRIVRRDSAQTSQAPLNALLCEVAWESDGARHRDAHYFPTVEAASDHLPPELIAALENAGASKGTSQGDSRPAEVEFGPGALVPDRNPDRVVTLSPSSFDGHLPGLGDIEPRPGRFYPGQLLAGGGGPSPAERGPFRVLDIDREALVVDFNHPLAGKSLRLSARTEPSAGTISPAGGGLIDPIRTLLGDGPGMQGRLDGIETAFFDEHSFARADQSDDAGFYLQPRLVDHLDSTAISEISALYGRLIPPGARILDLMSSWHSHLPSMLEAESITGLGINADELARNPVLNERVVHDLNAEPRLPFGDERFDAVVCTVSVEYLIDPIRVFEELGRVLTPGGVAVMTFSNRWFPPKVIRGWAMLHEFERPGLVSEYFHRGNRFGDCHTWSLRGRPRPPDDPYAYRLPHSDPIHAVWAFRSDSVRAVSR